MKKSGESAELSRRIGTVGGLTFCSRLAGLVRDMVVAFFFGTGMAADAFYVAFRIPNLVRRLLAEGALTMAFVPIYADYRRESAEEGRRAADTIFTALFLLLLVLVGLGIVFAPWLVKMVAYGFAEDPEKFALTVSLARVMFPYLMMVSVMALMMGILNSHKHFIAPAAAPILFNLGLISGAVVIAQRLTSPIYGLAIGVLCGGLAQMLVQVPPLWKRQLMPRFTAVLRHPSLRQMIRIMIPSVYGGAVYQLNVMLITLLASFLPSGTVSYLWYADRITEFPLGIFAVAIATVTLPTLAEQRSAQDESAFTNTLNFGLRMAFAISIPAAAGISVLAEPIVRLLFEGGAFGVASTQGTVETLLCFAVGIPLVSGVRNLVPAYYAMKDAKTPVKIATVALAVNAVVALSLMDSWKHQGLASGIVAASTTQFVLLLLIMRRRLSGFALGCFMQSVLRSAAAAAIMAVCVYFVADWMLLSDVTARLAILPRLLACIGIGVLSYALCLRVLNREAFDYCVGLLRRR